jgi:translation initiation factor 5
MLAIAGNLNKDKKADPAYRYKMPPIMGKVEGRGNGIKTCIVNCADVAEKLHRTPEVLCKFFGCELATQSRITQDRAIINGKHDDRVLQQLVDIFIDKFVLCPNCLLPETKLSIKSNGDIWHKCKACGAKSLVDMNHKLCTFIIAQNKKEKKEAKKSGGKKKDGDGDEKKKKKSKKEKKEKKVKKKKSEEVEESDESDLSGDDADVPSGGSPGSPGGDKLQRVAKTMASFISEEQRTPDQIVEKMLGLQQSFGFRGIDRVAILYNAYKSLEMLAPAGIKANNKVFAQVIIGEVSQYALLGCIEHHFGVEKAELAKAVPLILKELYDQDLLSDMVLVAWFDGPKTEFSPASVSEEALTLVKAKAEIFINWMKNLESSGDESDSGSDDDDEEENADAAE